MAANTCSRTRPNRREAITAIPTTPAERRVLGSATGTLMKRPLERFGPLGDLCFAASAPGPVRRPFFRVGSRPLDEVLRSEQGGHRRIAPLAANGRLEAGLVQSLHHRL